MLERGHISHTKLDLGALDAADALFRAEHNQDVMLCGQQR